MKKRQQQESAELFVHFQKKKKELGLGDDPISSFEKFILGEALFGIRDDQAGDEIKEIEGEIKKLQLKLRIKRMKRKMIRKK